jgi:transposase
MDCFNPLFRMLKNNEAVILEDGIEVQQTKAYGIGIDCHSRFIQVSVYVKRNLKFYEYRHEFNTDWNSLIRSKEWALTVITTCSDPVPDMSSIPFHYCIESTSTYHMSILLAWEGSPSIVNPTIAGSTKRKTDVLDAKLLALHDLTGVWPQSYLPSVDVKALRVMISERNRYIHDATSAGNRINNVAVRFGLTVGRDGSVVKNSTVRSIIEDQISDYPSVMDDICPISIPYEVRLILREEFNKYDFCVSCAENLKALIREKVLSMEWETASGTLSGTEMLSILTSAPQIGDITAITWLAHIITPRRFSNSRALAAYCGLNPSLKTSAKHVTSTVKRGGCKELHKALTSSADRLIRHHSEMFGRWGFMLYQQTGKWKKAANAVARKLAVAMYYMMLTGQEFSYEKYSLVKSMDVFDIPVSELPSLNPDFKRYIRILEENGIHTTNDMAVKYLACELGSVKGLGRKFFITIKDFLNNQNKYKKLYNELRKGGSNEP